MVCSPIFIIYLVFLSALVFFPESRLKAAIIYLTFIFIFEASSFGADYNNYVGFYETNCEGLGIESLYVVVTYYTKAVGIPFGTFRFLWGSVWVGLICYSIYKMNAKHFSLSFLLLYLGYPVYTLSAVRQLATMAIGFWCVYRMFYKRDVILPVLASFVSSHFHQSGYLYLMFFGVSGAIILISRIVGKIRKKPVSFAFPSKIFSKFCSYGWFIGVVAFVALRFVALPVSYREPFLSIIAKITGIYNTRTLFSFGIFSRAILLMLIMWMYPHLDGKKDIAPVVLFYVACMAAYIIIPVETFCGRLFNNGRIFEVLLIPLFYERLSSYEKSEKKFMRGYGESCSLPAAKTFLVLCIAVYAVMFYRQMCTVDAYTEYTNIFSFLDF